MVGVPEPVAQELEAEVVDRPDPAPGGEDDQLFEVVRVRTDGLLAEAPCVPGVREEGLHRHHQSPVRLLRHGPSVGPTPVTPGPPPDVFVTRPWSCTSARVSATSARPCPRVPPPRARFIGRRPRASSTRSTSGSSRAPASGSSTAPGPTSAERAPASTASVGSRGWTTSCARPCATRRWQPTDAADANAPGTAKHRTSELRRVVRRVERSGTGTGLDDHGGVRERRDQPVPGEEPPP